MTQHKNIQVNNGVYYAWEETQLSHNTGGVMQPLVRILNGISWGN